MVTILQNCADWFYTHYGRTLQADNLSMTNLLAETHIHSMRVPWARYTGFCACRCQWVGNHCRWRKSSRTLFQGDLRRAQKIFHSNEKFCTDKPEHKTKEFKVKISNQKKEEKLHRVCQNSCRKENTETNHTLGIQATSPLGQVWGKGPQWTGWILLTTWIRKADAHLLEAIDKRERERTQHLATEPTLFKNTPIASCHASRGEETVICWHECTTLVFWIIRPVQQETTLFRFSPFVRIDQKRSNSISNGFNSQQMYVSAVHQRGFPRFLFRHKRLVKRTILEIVPVDVLMSRRSSSSSS